jgi:hypothetical protein
MAVSLLSLTSSFCPDKTVLEYIEEKTKKTLNKIHQTNDLKFIFQNLVVETENRVKAKLNKVFPLYFYDGIEIMDEFTDEESQQGICSGISLWFAHLLFSMIQFKGSLEETDIARLATKFSCGGGKVPILLQKISDECDEVINFKKKVIYQIRNENIVNFQSMPSGMYLYDIDCRYTESQCEGNMHYSSSKSESHRCVLIKLSDTLLYLFDPNKGLIRINNENNDAGKALLSHSESIFQDIFHRIEQKNIHCEIELCLLESLSFTSQRETAGPVPKMMTPFLEEKGHHSLRNSSTKTETCTCTLL